MITLTNGVQVPENAVQLQTTAAIDGYYVTQPLRLVQYDETLPVAAVQLTYQNQPYTPPAGAELNVRMGKPDGKGVYNPCLGVDSSGIVYFVFTQQMTAAAGDGKLTVEVTDSGVKNSAPITVNVAENPVQEGSIESADEFLTLQEILAEAEKWGQIVQANAANIQEVIDNLPAIEAAPEAAQQAAASAAAAQQAAQEALGFRTFFSAVRPDANGNLDPSRPMTVGPAASVEIESKGDRIQSVTAHGFTQQAGSGDPSLTNVRTITSAGVEEDGKLYAQIVIDGASQQTIKLPITEKLCEGDSVVSWAKSGCDKQLTLDGSTLTVTASGSNYTVVAANAAAGGAVYASGLSGLSLTDGSITIPGTAFPASVTNAGQVNTWLQSNPQTLYYQSADYTEDADEPVSLEKHAKAYFELAVATMNNTEASPGWKIKNLSAIVGTSFNGAVSSAQCSISKAIWANTLQKSHLFFKDSAVDGLTQSEIQAQYPDLVVQVVLPRITSIAYAHPPVEIVAATGEHLTYTVTEQAGGQVSVALKPFQDGGNAKRLDGHTWDEVPGQAPVQSVNSKTGEVTLGAADVGAATAEQGNKADSAVQPYKAGDSVSIVGIATGHLTGGGRGVRLAIPMDRPVVATTATITAASAILRGVQGYPNSQSGAFDFLGAGFTACTATIRANKIDFSATAAEAFTNALNNTPLTADFQSLTIEFS